MLPRRHREVLSSGFPGRVVHNLLTEVPTIIGVHPVSIDFTEAEVIRCHGVPGKIAIPGTPFHPLAKVVV